MIYRRTIDLGGSRWQVGSVAARPAEQVASWDYDSVEEWLPATVPGDVRADLLAAGRIPDPYLQLNNEMSQWVDERDWWYWREVSASRSAGERAFLVFEGIDYLSAVYLDGELLGCHEGMFSRQAYEVTRWLTASSQSHQLAVRIAGSASLPKPQLTGLEQLWNGFTGRLPKGGQAFPDRFGVMKCQMGFGWDFAARMRTMGIWDPVSLVIVRSVLIRDVRAATSLEGDRTHIGLRLSLDSDCSQHVTIEIEVREREARDCVARQTLSVDLSPGVQELSTSVTLEHPRLWQPWDRGESYLYDLTVSVSRPLGGEHVSLDSQCIPLGIREVSLKRPVNASPTTEPWLFHINGQFEFIRGANWVPLDALPGRLRTADYAEMLDLARSVGINMLRIWGGGLREKTDFYRLCDEKGILVWQDFPFACAFLGYYPFRGRFVEVARQECTEIVRQLRNHPSLVLWCGGNEFGPHRNRPLIEMLSHIVAEEDGTRSFKRVSPDHGESHNWRIWHGRASVSHFRRDRSSFLGEFGLQAPPNLDSLHRFLSPEGLWPPGKEWIYHGVELGKMLRYARSWLPWHLLPSTGRPRGDRTPHSLEELIAATQQAQAHGLQVAIEHFRRRKGVTGGTLVWQLNDPWPAISWSVLDYYRQPKAAYHKLSEVYNPILLSVLYGLKPHKVGENFRFEVWGINDLLVPVEGAHFEVLLDGKSLLTGEVSLPPDSRQLIARAAHVFEKAPRELSVRLTQGDCLLSANHYDLTYHVRWERTWPDHFFAWLAELALKW